jgi:hypothetical protein
MSGNGFPLPHRNIESAAFALSEASHQVRGGFNGTMSLSHITDTRGAPARRLSARSTASRPAVVAPWLEQAILFGMFSAAAGFWMAVIWWIVR